MIKRFIKEIFPFWAVLVLTPWPIVYAQSYSADLTRQEVVQIEVAQDSAKPKSTVFRNAIGGVATLSDLFYVDTTNSADDIQVTLYITNTQELIRYYRYLILKVGVYVENNAGEWEKTSTGSGELIPDTVITLHNARVSLTIPRYAKHKIAIDSGCFYCSNANVMQLALLHSFT